MLEVEINKQLKKFDISLKFSSSKNRCVIFGPSGSGKSSLLKMIAGFYDPDEGKIRVNGKTLFDKSKKISVPIRHRNIGYLPQEYTLFPNMTIKENIQYGLVKRGIKSHMDIYALADRFGIANCLDSFPHQISGGQKQRAALARALIVKPDIVLLDEPFSALDKPIREELRDLVAEVADSLSISVLFVTHDIEEAFLFAETIVLIKDGAVLEFGDKNRLFLSPEYVESAKLLGFGNIWKIKNMEDGLINLENSLKLIATSTMKGADFCCIKPEDVMILRNDRDISDKENRVVVTIEKINLRGRYVNILTKTKQNIPVVINIQPHIMSKMSLSKGKKITVSLKKESVVLCRRRDI